MLEEYPFKSPIREIGMLRVTQLTNYGIVLLDKLASEEDDSHLSCRDLAQQLELPLSVTAKILKSLTRNGILISHRGINGGYELARPAGSISIGEVVAALEGPLPTSPAASDCGFHPCDFINRTIHQTLMKISLSDMARTLDLSPKPANAPLTESIFTPDMETDSP